jgi:hypothetical protein
VVSSAFASATAQAWTADEWQLTSSLFSLMSVLDAVAIAPIMSSHEPPLPSGHGCDPTMVS